MKFSEFQPINELQQIFGESSELSRLRKLALGK